MSLQTELGKRNRILEQIANQQDIISGNFDKELLDRINTANKERTIILNNFKNLQSNVRNENDINRLNLIYSDLKENCDNLSSIDNVIKDLKIELNTKQQLSYIQSDLDKKIELERLFNELNKNTEQIAKEREAERIQNLKDDENKKYKGLPNSDTYGNLEWLSLFGKNGDAEKVVVDEDFGIYINYPKFEVISATMSSLLGSVLNKLPDDETKEKVFAQASKLNAPGLPTFLSVSIDIMLKAISQGYVKQFFFVKNSLDSLVGLDIGQIISNSIPGLVKMIKDMTILLTDPEAWMFKKMLGPIFDLNTPIPSFSFDLGSLIPILPFGIGIPKIDPYDYFTKKTAVNINADPSEIPNDWLQRMLIENKKLSEIKENEYKDEQISKKNRIDNDIKKLTNDLNKVNIKTKEIENIKKNEIQLNSKYDKLKDKVNTANADELIEIEKELESICQQLSKNDENIKNLELEEKSENDRLNNLDNNLIKDELLKLNSEKNELKDKPVVSYKELSKRTMMLAYEQKIRSDDLTTKLSKAWDAGINIYDNDVTEYLQKLGHSFANDNDLYKLIELKDKYGFNFNNAKHLNRLYNLGFNFNDPNYLIKLNNLKRYKIDILNTEILMLLIEMGFNFNNANVYVVVSKMNDIGINLNDKEILIKLNIIGFNFNNPNLIDRLIKLQNYVDIKNAAGYDNAINKNVNLNNPYFYQLLDKYQKIGLQWNNENFMETEQEILNTITISEIEQIQKILLDFSNNNDIYFHSSLSNNQYKKYLYTFDITEKLNDFGINLSYSNDFLYKEEFSIVNPIWYENLNINNQIVRIKHDNGYLYKEITVNVGGILQYNYIPLYCIPIFNFKNKNNIILQIINKWKKYNINLNLFDDSLTTLTEVVYSGNNKFSILNKEIINVKMLSDKKEIESKLDLMKDFILNRGWVINGIRISDNLNELDYQKIVDASVEEGVITAVNNINVNNNQVSYEQIIGLYGNFDKLGLNIRDANFEDKVKDLTYKLKVRIDEAVILDTKKQVLLTYYDFKQDKDVTIDLSNSKVDPEIFQDDRYNASLKITNLIDTNVTRQPTKTMVQFDSLNKMGFNFQADYNVILNKLNGLSFDINKFESVGIVDSLSVLGWHINAINSIEKLDKLIDIGFSFKLSDDITQNMENKLTSLSVFGFNLNKVEWENMISKMKSIGLNMKNLDFEKAIDRLIGFGINLNDPDWENKLSKINSLGLNFNNPEWTIKFDNLDMLGFDFSNKNWITNYNKILSLKKLGIDYSEVENRQKIQILRNSGIDFMSNEDDYMQKLNCLVDLKLLAIPETRTKEKNEYLNVRNNKIKKLNNREIYLVNVLNGIEIEKYKNDIKLLKIKQINLSNEIINIKSSNIQNLSQREMYLLSETLKVKCDEISQIDIKIEKKLELIKEISNMKIDDINLELDLINNERINLKDTSYKINDDIKFENLDKFKGFDELGLDFRDPNYLEIVNDVKKTFDFGLPNWKELLPDVALKIPKNPILQWQKMITNVMITIITLPLKLIIGLIKTLLNFIKSFINIPLNPAKIVEWIPGIIKKFKEIIDMMLKLPSFEGMMDFLFVGDSGLKMFDIFIPGMSAMIIKIKDKLLYLKDNINNDNKELINLKNKAEKLKTMKNKRIIELKSKIEINKSYLDGTAFEKTKSLNFMIEQKIKAIEQSNDLLKNMIKFDLSEETITKIEIELNENCEQIKMLSQQIDNNNKEYEKIIKKPDDITKLENQLANLDSVYDTNDIYQQIDILNERIKENSDKLTLSDITKWIPNIGMIFSILNEIDDEENNKPNPYDELCDAKNKEIEILKKQNNTDKLITAQKQLKEFEEKRKDINLDKIKKKEEMKKNKESFPVVLNILTTSPKIIGNICVGLFNSVAYMENLPTLWEIPLIK